MVVLWPVYISLHGATSVNLGGRLWGRGPEFWGAMMEGPANLLIAAGLFGMYPLLAGHRGRVTRAGFALVATGLIVTGLADLVMLGIVPPFLSPVVGTGLLMLTLGRGDHASLPGLGRIALWSMGVLLWSSFLWTALLPLAVFDRINGYATYGVMAHVLVGVGWIVVASSPWVRRRGG